MPAVRRFVGSMTIAMALGLAVVLGLVTKKVKPSGTARQAPKAGLECGHWAVFRACELLGVPISPKKVREMMPAGPRGHSLLELADALNAIGFETRGRKEGFETFLSGQGIRIVHMTSPDHFIVVLRSSPERIFFFDDRGRHRHAPPAMLKKRWSGNMLYVDRPADEVLPRFVKPDTLSHQPCIQFDRLFIDKGDIPLIAPSQVIEYQYPVRNAGGADLMIKKVHTNCACLVAKSPEKAIPPGSSETITLRYSVDGRRRAFIHEALVETNDPAFPAIILRAAGNADALVSVSPPAVDLAAIPVGQTKRAFVFVRYSGEEAFAIGEVTCSIPRFNVQVRETAGEEVADHLWPRSHGQVDFGKVARILEVMSWFSLIWKKRSVELATKG